MGGGDGATRAASFIDRALEGELADGETVVARGYLRPPAAPSRGGGIIAARILGLFGLGGGRRRGPKIAYLAALTDRRLALIETRHSVAGPQLSRRHLLTYGRGDIRVSFTDGAVLLETRDGHSFRWGLTIDDTTTGEQRRFFEALAAQAGVGLPPS